MLLRKLPVSINSDGFEQRSGKTRLCSFRGNVILASVLGCSQDTLTVLLCCNSTQVDETDLSLCSPAQQQRQSGRLHTVLETELGDGDVAGEIVPVFVRCCFRATGSVSIKSFVLVTALTDYSSTGGL